MNTYLENIYNKFSSIYKNEEEYLASLYKLLTSLDEVVSNNPDLIKYNIVEKIVTPNNIVTFDVEWTDDLGNQCTNKGYRVQYDNTLGPYKGGLRFHPTVNLSVLKALALEQVFKNALTGLDLGGAKGGSDFDPKGKSDEEIKRFCYAFMKKLYPYIGSKNDVPAGDIGVGGKEISYLYDAYKSYIGKDDFGALTGKPVCMKGSLGRVEATGYGLCFFALAALKKMKNTTLDKKRVVISGSGNVAIYACEMAYKLGATVVAMSDSNGYVYTSKGIDLNIIKKIKLEEKGRIKEYLDFDKNAVFNPDSSLIWSIPCDVALPCATQNEIDEASADKLIENGCIAIFEGSNIALTPLAQNKVIEKEIIYSPGKASNAGGVLVSGLEMIQNETDNYWSFDEVISKLKSQMELICEEVFDTAASLGVKYNSVIGANITAFNRISNACLEKIK